MCAGEAPDEKLKIAVCKVNGGARRLSSPLASLSKMRQAVFAVVFFLFGTSFSEAQQSPLRSTTSTARIIPKSAIEGCPSVEQLEAARNEIDMNLNVLLRTLTPVDVSRYCGSGAWTRIVHIDMTNTSQHCPGTFREYSSPVRTCGRRSTSSASCDSATFSVNGAQYNRVCGRVIAYQIGSPDAFYPGVNDGQSIDSYYLDGISITHGSPRQHIWSFAASPTEIYHLSSRICPCSNTQLANTNPPSFVGSDYFCETSDTGDCCREGHFFAGDPLFDGQGCGSNSTCCSFNNPPWFSKQLSTTTTNSIEVRVCSNEGTSVDDVPFQILEIYIQ